MIQSQNIKLFFISFLFCCPVVLSNNPQINNPETQQTPEAKQTEDSLDRETFESLMTMSREHTKNLGFCIQQILQTLSSNKEQIQIPNKSQIVKTLIQLQDIVEFLIQDTYSKNTKAALIEGIIFTNGIMHFLLVGIKTNFQDFGTAKLIALIHKKSGMNISDETILSLIKKNAKSIENLLYASDRIGLTWYNLAYRKFTDYNGYAILKNGAIIGASAFLVGYLIHLSPLIKADGGLLHRVFGKKRRTDNLGKDKYDTAEGLTLGDIQKEKQTLQPEIAQLKDHSEANKTDLQNKEDYFKSLEQHEAILKKSGKTSIWVPVTKNDPETIFQFLETYSSRLRTDGIIAMGALCTISFSGIAEYLLGDWYKSAKIPTEKTLEDLDKLMSGKKSNKALNPDGQEKVYFKDLVGCEELEALATKIANFIKHPERYERAQIEEHRGILLYGPPQTGKSLFAKALRTLIQDTLGDERNMSFIDGKKYLDYGYPLDMIFKEAEYLAPCILFFDEIDLIGTNREKDPKKTGQLLTCMQGIDISSKQIIVIGATNRIEQLDKALLVDGRFGKKIFIGYPDYMKRKMFLEKELSKRAIKLSAEFIDHIAQETENCSYNNLRRIITEAIILSANETRIVCQNDFEKTLDTEIRKIDRGSRNNSSKEEKEIIAVYQAGKAIARHILQTKQQVVKITIEDVARTIKTGQTGFVFTNSDSDSSENEKLATNPTSKDSKMKLGEVFTKSSINAHELVSDTETKKECLALLAGGVAQQIILNSTFSQCNKHDRAEAMQMIYAVIGQGEKIDDKVRAKAMQIKDSYEQEIKNILEENKDLLTTVINELIEKTTVDRYDWARIISAQN